VGSPGPHRNTIQLIINTSIFVKLKIKAKINIKCFTLFSEVHRLLTLCKIHKVMTTVIINDRTPKGKSLLQFLKNFEGENFIYIAHEPNDETKEAIEDARQGRVTSHTNSKELFASLKRRADV
jgi:hypothetical protein